jgi:hypothetical protein
MKSGVMGEEKKCSRTQVKDGTVWDVRTRKRSRRKSEGHTVAIHMKSGVMGEEKKCGRTPLAEGDVSDCQNASLRRYETDKPRGVVDMKSGAIGGENKSAAGEGHRGLRISQRKEGALRGATRWSVPAAIVRRIVVTP